MVPPGSTLIMDAPRGFTTEIMLTIASLHCDPRFPVTVLDPPDPSRKESFRLMCVHVGKAEYLSSPERAKAARP